MKTVYVTTIDNTYGGGPEFFVDYSLIEELMESDISDFEEFDDSCKVVKLTFPDDFNFASAGIVFSDEKQRERLAEGDD